MSTPSQILHDLVEAVYGGCERPQGNAAVLRAIADYLDKIDDVPDNLARSIDAEWRVNREMQFDLRRIADEYACAVAAQTQTDEAIQRLLFRIERHPHDFGPDAVTCHVCEAIDEAHADLTRTEASE